MIHLRLRTEYSFRRAFGRVADVIKAAEGSACAITDNATWGHVAWAKECKKQGKRPIFGVELEVVDPALLKDRAYGVNMVFLAKDQEGLAELYALVTRAYKDLFYYRARVSYAEVNALSAHVVVLSGVGPRLDLLKRRPDVYLELSPSGPGWNMAALRLKGWDYVVTCDNFYVSPTDRTAYEVLVGDYGRVARTTLLHIPTEEELRNALPHVPGDAWDNTDRIGAECVAVLPRAPVVEWPTKASLVDWCKIGARGLGCDLKRPAYRERLARELRLIEDKGFTDYFLVIADMVRFARERMLVGPGRGSAAGSLVCYLLGITNIDPLQHGLMFERFIDVTRADLPDIDIDFPDVQRDEVMGYLVEQYGAEKVGRIGTVLRFQTRSAIGNVAKQLNIPAWETKDLQGAIIKRSTGDARAQFAVADAFDTLDAGKALVAKYPQLRVAARLEGHATTSGTHAAGFVVAAEPVTSYGAITRDGTLMLDKKDAEALNILKIDALGLRTLSVLQHCLNALGLAHTYLVRYRLDDIQAFKVLNEDRFAGIFQFEGYALQILTKQMRVREFLDIVALTALARPGPLHGGATQEFVERRIGSQATVPLHPLIKDITAETYGTVIYQEQVMAIGRTMGKLSWEDVSELRKAMAKSLGEEFFNTFWEKFRAGSREHGIDDGAARAIWDKVCTFGSWAFNKSHAVSYGLLSYWCAVLKAHHPLQFAASTLRYAKDEEQTIKLLRELSEEGIPFEIVNPKTSMETWEVVGKKLVGGLTNIKGIGPRKAQEIIAARRSGKALPKGLSNLLAQPITPYDRLFEGRERFGDVYANPKAYKVMSGPVHHIRDMQEPGTYVFLGRLKEKNLRDLNEYGSVAKRGGKIIERNNLFLNLYLEDDTGGIFATIGRFDFVRLGKPLLDTGRLGDWYMWRGEIRNNWRKVYINKMRKL